MATAYVSAGQSATKEGEIKAPVIYGQPVLQEILTTSTSNAQTTGAIPANGGVFQIFSDTAHWAAIGSNPDATVSGARWYIAANQYYEIAGAVGDKLALATIA